MSGVTRCSVSRPASSHRGAVCQPSPRAIRVTGPPEDDTTPTLTVKSRRERNAIFEPT
jgi:hypothetical protein